MINSDLVQYILIRGVNVLTFPCTHLKHGFFCCLILSIINRNATTIWLLNTSMFCGV